MDITRTVAAVSLAPSSTVPVAIVLVAVEAALSTPLGAASSIVAADVSVTSAVVCSGVSLGRAACCEFLLCCGGVVVACATCLPYIVVWALGSCANIAVRCCAGPELPYIFTAICGYLLCRLAFSIYYIYIPLVW